MVKHTKLLLLNKFELLKNLWIQTIYKTQQSHKLHFKERDLKRREKRSNENKNRENRTTTTRSNKCWLKVSLKYRKKKQDDCFVELFLLQNRKRNWRLLRLIPKLRHNGENQIGEKQWSASIAHQYLLISITNLNRSLFFRSQIDCALTIFFRPFAIRHVSL